MNGFKMMADSYRKAAEEGKITREQAEKDCKTFDFLANCDQDDFNNLFDSGAFNDIAKSYMRIAVKELVEEGTLEEEQAQAVKNRFALLFSEKTAKDVLK